MVVRALEGSRKENKERDDGKGNPKNHGGKPSNVPLLDDGDLAVMNLT